VIIITSSFPITPIQEVSAAFIGNDGALPGGGTLGKGGGMCSATIYRVGIAHEGMKSGNELQTITITLVSYN